MPSDSLGSGLQGKNSEEMIKAKRLNILNKAKDRMQCEIWSDENAVAGLGRAVDGCCGSILPSRGAVTTDQCCPAAEVG